MRISLCKENSGDYMGLGKKERPHSPFSFHLLASFVPGKSSHSAAEGREEMPLNHSDWSTPRRTLAFLQSCFLTHFSANNSIWVSVKTGQRPGSQAPRSLCTPSLAAVPNLGRASPRKRDGSCHHQLLQQRNVLINAVSGNRGKTYLDPISICFA